MYDSLKVCKLFQKQNKIKKKQVNVPINATQRLKVKDLKFKNIQHIYIYKYNFITET